MLRFRAAGRGFALPTAQVREVTRLPRLTRVPNAPSALLGLGNLRGAVLPVLSFAALLGHPDQGSSNGVVIVVEGEHPSGLAVQAVQGVTGSAAGDTAFVPIDTQALLAPLFSAASSGAALPATDAAASAAPEQARNRIPLLVFAVADQAFALPVGVVEEIIAVPAETAALPYADAAVIGAASHRGALLPLLSLRALLGLAAPADATRPRVLLIRLGTHLVGFTVDAVRAVVDVDEADIDAVPAVLTRGQGEARIQAICRMGDGSRLVSILAAEHLLNNELTLRLLAGGGTAGSTDEAMAAASEQFLAFRIGGQGFALPIEAVAGVALLPAKLTRLPKAPTFVLGLMNYRGQAIPVVEQASRFHADAGPGKRPRVIIVHIRELQVGFLVEAASGVLRVPAEAIRPAPELGEEARMFDRVAVEGEQMVLIVSPDELLNRAERELLAGLTHARRRSA